MIIPTSLITLAVYAILPLIPITIFLKLTILCHTISYILLYYSLLHFIIITSYRSPKIIRGIYVVCSKLLVIGLSPNRPLETPSPFTKHFYIFILPGDIPLPPSLYFHIDNSFFSLSLIPRGPFNPFMYSVFVFSIPSTRSP